MVNSEMANLRDKFQRLIRPPDDEYEEYYDEEEQEDEDYGDYSESRRSSYAAFSTRTDPRENKVVNFSAKSQLQMVVFKPTSFGEEARNIADELLKRHTVVLNLEKTDKEANNGKLKPIAANIVIVTPYNVDVMGDDVLDELESSGIYF